MPKLPAYSQKTDTIGVSMSDGSREAAEDLYITGGKWEDEEERKFFEDLQDMKDYVPKSVLGMEEDGEVKDDGTVGKAAKESTADEKEEKEQERKRMEEEEARVIEEELKKLQLEEATGEGEKVNGHAMNGGAKHDHDDEEG